jgi:hypothetical protein
LILRLSGQTSTRHAAEFIVDQRNEFLAGRFFAVAPAREQLRDLVG